jgi:hypothetical protein
MSGSAAAPVDVNEVAEKNRVSKQSDMADMSLLLLLLSSSSSE